MSYEYFSRNSVLLPTEQAVVPLDDVAYAYGYGVYETIRLSKGTVYFLDEHLGRLMKSAEILALPHGFDIATIAKNIHELIARNAVDSCNLKLLLVGGPTAADARLDILCLNPLYPDRKLYAHGASAITYRYEREFPHAKSLNMLPSYLAYRDARQAGAYDALLINRNGCVTEGTRTNFFAIRDHVITTPPAETILLGVMRAAVLEFATRQGFTIEEQSLPLVDLPSYDGAFLTSTSSKIMPLRAIDNHIWPNLSPALLELMRTFSSHLQTI